MPRCSRWPCRPVLGALLTAQNQRREENPGRVAHWHTGCEVCAVRVWILHRVDAVRACLSDCGLRFRDAQAALDANDPYANEPRPRHPALKVAQEKPFNAETAVALIRDHYITPNELWYCRHHHPVPDIDASSFRFELCVDHGSSPTRLSVGLAELKEWYPSHTATVTTQCGGNRRSELNDVAKTQGLSWGVGTISTATWRGVYVRDILASVGVTDVQSAIDAGIRCVLGVAWGRAILGLASRRACFVEQPCPVHRR